MGARDIVTKDYMADPVVFADAFNYFLYGGRQVIDPRRLKKKDTVATAVPYGKGRQSAAIQKYRDNMKSLAMMEDGNAEYLILGIENQTNVNYAMPVRNMLYDAMQYAEQVNQRAKAHRREKDLGGGEFLSGFSGEDKLVPVITLVILFDSEPWDGPKSLHEMFSMQEKELLEFISDYKLNLMVPAAMSDEEINRLSSSLREVIIFLKYATDKEQMAEIMKRNDRFKNLDRQAANVINTLMNCNLKIDEEKEEGLDMCKAWDDMREDARMEGKALGLEEGTITSISNLMSSMSWSMEQAMDALKLSANEKEYYAGKLNS